MPGSENPVEEIGGIDTSSAVNKASLVSWGKANVVQVLENPNDLRARSMDGQNMLGIRSTGRIYHLDTTDTTTPDNGVWCVRDFDGLGYFTLSPEFQSSELLFASRISLTNTVPANITSLSLAAGDWEVHGHVAIGASVSFSLAIGWVNTVSATVPATPNGGAYNSTGPDTQFVAPTGPRRYAFATTTTVYLSVDVFFASGTCEAWGGLYARRLR